MYIFFNGIQTYSNQTLSFTRDLTNPTYEIVCASLGSKPDVSLSLYDTNSFIQLSNSLNSIIQGSCSSLNLCNQYLQVNFQFTDSRFDSMASLSCSTSSKNPSIQLTQYIQRNTTVLKSFTSKKYFKNNKF